MCIPFSPHAQISWQCAALRSHTQLTYPVDYPGWFTNFMTSQDFSWRLALTDADLSAAYNLRHKVYVEEQGFDADRDMNR